MLSLAKKYSTEKVSSEAPYGNTGFEGQEPDYSTFGTTTHHWIQGVAIVPDLENFVKFCTRFGSSGAAVIWRPGQGQYKGRQWYNSAQSTDGTQFLWNNLDGGMFRVWFSIPGGACERISGREQVRLIVGLRRHFKAGFTRIDVKVRVSKDIISAEECLTHARAGNYGIVQTHSYTVSLKPNGDESITVYFGASGSDSRTRIYDPEVMHGVQGCTDIEVQLQDDKSNKYADYLCDMFDSDDGSSSDDDELALFMASTAVGQMKLVDRKVNDRLDRCPPIPAWERLIDYIGGSIRMIASRPVKTFDKFLSFCKRNVWRTMAAYVEAVGFNDVMNMLRDEISEARFNLTSEHLSLIEEYKINQQKIYA